jgi:hypothetical protein
VSASLLRLRPSLSSPVRAPSRFSGSTRRPRPKASAGCSPRAAGQPHRQQELRRCRSPGTRRGAVICLRREPARRFATPCAMSRPQPLSRLPHWHRDQPIRHARW